MHSVSVVFLDLGLGFRALGLGFTDEGLVIWDCIAQLNT